MFGLRPEHLLIIAIVAFIVFGPKHLPRIGSSIAKAFRDLRSGIMGEGVHEELANTPSPTAEQALAASTPTAPISATMETPAASVDAPIPAGPFCTRCGAANPPASQYCHKCGQQLVEKVA